MLKQVAAGASSLSTDDLKNLKKRKLVELKTRKSYRIEKGAEYNEVRRRRYADISREMLGNKSEVGLMWNVRCGCLIFSQMAEGTHWSDASFKSVNLTAMGAAIQGGSFHPLLKVRAEFRRILMEMGFEEMPTNKWVESSFWNFDSLFQPQSHPARDAHDTFFMKVTLHITCTSSA